MTRKPMTRKALIKAVTCYRTSSMTNVGPDKDTLPRQRKAVEKFAKAAGYEIVAEFTDDGVKGADPVDTRPGFAEMLKRLASNGVKTILVETANRFARDLLVQEVGYRLLRDAGITLIAVDSPDAFISDTPSAVMIGKSSGPFPSSRKRCLSPSSAARANARGRLALRSKAANRSPSAKAEPMPWPSPNSFIRLASAVPRCVRSPLSLRRRVTSPIAASRSHRA